MCACLCFLTNLRTIYKLYTRALEHVR
jgi:hypothetical protein